MAGGEGGARACGFNPSSRLHAESEGGKPITPSALSFLSGVAIHSPIRPILPVRQNWQFIAQPTCEDTQMVIRRRSPASLMTGISTVSMVRPAAGPSVRRKASFLVPAATEQGGEVSGQPWGGSSRRRGHSVRLTLIGRHWKDLVVVVLMGCKHAPPWSSKGRGGVSVRTDPGPHHTALPQTYTPSSLLLER